MYCTNKADPLLLQFEKGLLITLSTWAQAGCQSSSLSSHNLGQYKFVTGLNDDDKETGWMSAKGLNSICESEARSQPSRNFAHLENVG